MPSAREGCRGGAPLRRAVPRTQGAQGLRRARARRAVARRAHGGRVPRARPAASRQDAVVAARARGFPRCAHERVRRAGIRAAHVGAARARDRAHAPIARAHAVDRPFDRRRPRLRIRAAAAVAAEAWLQAAARAAGAAAAGTHVPARAPCFVHRPRRRRDRGRGAAAG